MKIALISDNHSYDGADILQHLQGVDEIWHAGDIGSLESLQDLLPIAPIRGVYGNVDDPSVRNEYPLDLSWECEGVKIFMTHIGGYPGRYKTRVAKLLEGLRPDVYICGHSHICKVVRDNKLDLLHMNPGAYGHHGFHKMRTMLKFEVEASEVKNLRVVELGYRGVTNRDFGM